MCRNSNNKRGKREREREQEKEIDGKNKEQLRLASTIVEAGVDGEEKNKLSFEANKFSLRHNSNYFKAWPGRGREQGLES